MFDNKMISELVSKLAAVVPPGLKQIPEDMEKTFQTILRAGLAKMELVTREEFDTQSKVLARTREKLEALEKRLNTMEKDGQ